MQTQIQRQKKKIFTSYKGKLEKKNKGGERESECENLSFSF